VAQLRLCLHSLAVACTFLHHTALWPLHIHTSI